MAKQKLQRFAELETFPNVFQQRVTFPHPDHFLKGKWHSDYFKNNSDIVLELGCGRGEYTVYLAEQFPNKNFFGIDIKGNRLWRGAKTALEKGFSNTCFMRIQIDHGIYYFAPNEVSEIWITFPDPQPQQTREHKRLTSPRFLNYYRKFLKPGGVIHLKTDSRFLFDYTREVVAQEKLVVHQDITDIYSYPDLAPELLVRTTYENMFLKKGVPINYIRFSFS